MLKRLPHLTALLVLLVLFCAPAAVWSEEVTPELCLECHDDLVEHVAAFEDSVHGDEGCIGCHTGLDDIQKHMDGEVMPKPVNCAECHDDVHEEYLGSVHDMNDVGCADCHAGIHTLQPSEGKLSAVAICSVCHDASDYEVSTHGQALQAGNEASASCVDCHGTHGVIPLSTDTFEARELNSKACIQCHGDEELMEEAGVFPDAVHSYLSSYHGKNYLLGYPELVAGCADCHTSHTVLPRNNPNSSVHKDNLVATCAECHPNSSAQFVKYYAHGDHADSEAYPILFWTFVAMSGLLIGTFATFWLHTLLWMIRGIAERRELKAAGHVHKPHHDGIIYKRFKTRHIFMHILVITSFLLLSLTGLPLKFAGQPWAETLMGFWGGAANAAAMHRVGAAITGVYFGMALLLSFHFLFIRKDIKGNFLQRMFGPDSLMPTFRDITDVVGMVRWFLFKGPKPTFERWTYWEKFDFIAVFWGMFAIGGSGLMLTFPELFGMFLPGWTLNVATIIHSDEALLATGFIFTVHFFNTHMRPEKFPMDFVIFNGELPEAEFIEERGDQLKRYQEEGMPEGFTTEKTSGPVYNLIFRIFGFSAVIVGLTLTVCMILAFINGAH